jgi:PHD/YefM family antitoxin component YafN of YafNO toxin-antitoxin module
MIRVPYSSFRRDLDCHLVQVVESGIPILVARQGGKGNVVILSEADFHGWRETVQLLSSPTNASRLLRSTRSAGGQDHSDGD